jgi:hypothetical protein
MRLPAVQPFLMELTPIAPARVREIVEAEGAEIVAQAWDNRVGTPAVPSALYCVRKRSTSLS